MKCARFAAFLVVAASPTACFVFDRTQDLQPGEIDGRAIFADDAVAAKFARVSAEGAGLVRRAGEDGRFRVKGLGEGAFVLRFTSDDDGDGIVERGALRAVSMAPYTKDGLPTLPSLLLGDVPLSGTGALRGVVVDGDDPASPPLGGAKVYVVREIAHVPAAVPEVPITTRLELGAEAATATDAEGRFVLEGLVAGVVKVVAVAGQRASRPLVVDVDPGPAQEVGDLAVRAAPSQRKASVLVSFPDAPQPVDLFLDPAGAAPDFDSVDGRSEGGAGELDVPFGAWDVRGVDEDKRRGVLLQQLSYPTDDDDAPLPWGTMLVRDEDPCASTVADELVDLDGDGARMMPNPAFDVGPWQRCAGACTPRVGAGFSSASCRDGEIVYDCDDDADGQPDTTEPYACVGLCGSTDLDGDGICDAADPLPQCAGDDPAAPACAQDGRDGDVPPLRPEYGGDAGVVADAGDADAGFVDAGSVDGGFVDAGFVDAGFVDAGFADAGFPTVDAGFPPAAQPFVRVFASDDAGPVDDDDVAVDVEVAGSRTYVLLQHGGNLRTPGCTRSANGADLASTIIEVDADGACSRARTFTRPSASGVPTEVRAHAVARLSGGRIVVVGEYTGELDTGTTTLTSGSNTNGFIVVLDTSLTPVQAIEVGQAGTTRVLDVAALGNGGFAVIGVHDNNVLLSDTITLSASDGYSMPFFARYAVGTGTAVPDLGETGGGFGPLADATAVASARDPAAPGAFLAVGNLVAAVIFDGTPWAVDATQGGPSAYVGRFGDPDAGIAWTRRIEGGGSNFAASSIDTSADGARFAVAGYTDGSIALPTTSGPVVFDPGLGGDDVGWFAAGDPATGDFPPDEIVLLAARPGDESRAYRARFFDVDEALVVGTEISTFAGQLDLFAGSDTFVARLQRGAGVPATWSVVQRVYASAGNGGSTGPYAVAPAADGSPLVAGAFAGAALFGEIPVATPFQPSREGYGSDGFLWRLLPDGASDRDEPLCATTSDCAAAGGDYDVCAVLAGRCVVDCALFPSICGDGAFCDFRTGLCGATCNPLFGIGCGAGEVCDALAGVCLPRCTDANDVCRDDACCETASGRCGLPGRPLVVQGDTWAHDGQFTALPSAGGPAVVRASVAEIPGGILLYGGDDEGSLELPLPTETWVWLDADQTWRENTTGGAPATALDGALALVDSDGGPMQVVQVAGFDSAKGFADTAGAYRVDGGVWSTPGGTGDPGHLRGAAAASNGYSGFVFGGTGVDDNDSSAAYFVNASFGFLSFSPVVGGPPPPAARHDARLAWHPGIGKYVLYGGVTQNGSALRDTWTFSPAEGWVLVDGVAEDAGVQPPARVDAMMAWDGDELLLFGGRDEDGELRDDTYAFQPDGGSWSVRAESTRPAPRASAAFAYDGDRAILHGGLVQQASQCVVGGREEPPPGWTCAANAYASGGSCDCGCGVPDPDCASLDLSSCQSSLGCANGAFAATADPTRCEHPTCGDGVIEGSEDCEIGGEGLPSCDLIACVSNF